MKGKRGDPKLVDAKKNANGAYIQTFLRSLSYYYC